MASTSDIRAGAAYVEMYLKNNRLVRGLRGSEQMLKGFGTRVAAIGAIVQGAGMAIMAPFLGAAKAFASAGDALDKMSVRVGASVEFLSGLSHAAQLGGTDLNAMETGIRRMQRAAYDAAKGSKTQAEAFDELGISVQGANGELKSTEDLFMETATALSGMENNTKKAALASVLFGRAGTQLLPMLREGKDGLLAAMEEAKKLGLVMSSEDATSAAELTDAMFRLTSTMKMGFLRVGAAVADELTEISNRAAKLAGRASEWIRANKPLILSIFKIGAAVAAAGAVIVAVGVTIIGFGATLGGLATIIGTVGSVVSVAGTALAALLSPVGLIAIALVGLGAAFLHFSGIGSKVMGWLGGVFGQLKDDALATFDSIKQALAAGDIQGAAQVFWALLKMEWTRGVAWLQGKWIGFKQKFLQVWDNASNDLAVTFIEVTAGLERVWTQVTGWFVDRWKWVEKNLAKGIGWLIAKLKGLSPEEILGDVQRQYDLQAGGRGAAREQRLARIEKDRQDRQQTLAEDRMRKQDQRAMAAQGELAGAAAKVAEAEEAWRQAREETARRAEAAEAGKVPREGGPDVDLGGAQEAGGRVAGSFSARALGLLGGGGAARTLQDLRREAIEQKRLMTSIERQIRRTKLVWQD